MEPAEEKKVTPKTTEDETKVEATTTETADSTQVRKRNPFAGNIPEELTKSHAFWDTQPVPKILSEKPIDADGELNPVHDLNEVPKDPYPLLDKFEWSNINMKEPKELEELYNFLYENYVEDEDGMFRFDYSKEFLVWALTPPGHYPEWMIGVRVIKSKKLVGFISGIPVHLHVNAAKLKMAEINFLCVHKKLRTNRLSPVLIKEVTRRVHLKDMWQAVYTAGRTIPTPIVSSKYFHRSLNPKKLIEVKFSSLPKNSTMARTVKLYKLPEEPLIPGIRLMKKKDVFGVHKLLSEYLKKFSVYLRFTEEDVKHWFLPREKIITTYVVETDKQITDIVSYYSLPSSILQHTKYDRLNAAYSFYNIATTVPFKDLMNDALILAAKDGFDVFNILNIFSNEEVFSDLKFSQGDGNLHYYLYNWALAKELKSSDIGIVLL